LSLSFSLFFSFFLDRFRIMLQCFCMLTGEKVQRGFLFHFLLPLPSFLFLFPSFPSFPFPFPELISQRMSTLESKLSSFIRTNHLSGIESLLRNHPKLDINQKPHTTPWNPLQWTCYVGNEKAVKFLLAYNATDGNLKYPPHWLLLASRRFHP